MVLEALSFEPSNVPDVFTHNGKVYQSPKSSLLKRLKPLSSVSKDCSMSCCKELAACSAPSRTQLIVDLSMVTKAFVAVCTPSKTQTIRDFYNQLWYQINCKSFDRIDIVSDNYEEPHLLNESTREERGAGTTVDFHIDSPLPSNFKTDLCVQPTKLLSTDSWQSTLEN